MSSFGEPKHNYQLSIIRRGNKAELINYQLSIGKDLAYKFYTGFSQFDQSKLTQIWYYKVI